MAATASALQGSDDNTIVSNRIGTSVDGTSAIANGGNGIWLTGGSDGNTIGGTVVGNDAARRPRTIRPATRARRGDRLRGTAAGQPGLGQRRRRHPDRCQFDGNTLNGNYVGTTSQRQLGPGQPGRRRRHRRCRHQFAARLPGRRQPVRLLQRRQRQRRQRHPRHQFGQRHDPGQLRRHRRQQCHRRRQRGDGILIDGNSQNTQVGGVIPLGNVVSGNGD